ncbi:PREDICTED: putative GPI-anchored protein PB15E9.01c [Ceratosolen solmsi marchali]|uniref:GPI-anchored protein PB15E9.01c n=1 Tax=Ceratosolen solmsi marchali TaxID=326594 RepID=A0AAJ7DXK6_9HYME|nr:PREDICTED: putative GPI-anchored protein PB15E9.01c [Ceratosolen solmsi marchali]
MKYSADLLGYAVLTFTLQFNGKVSAAGATCKDVNGLFHESGFHYILELEPCTLCVCDNGNPKLCKPFFCKYKDRETLSNAGVNCFGNTCCELICVDDSRSSINHKVDGNGTSMVDGNTNYDLGLRLVASCITALLCLGLLIFLIHRLRQRKLRAERQSHQLADDQRSLGSMGYLDRNNIQHGMPMDDLQYNGSYPLWKPPSNYFPRGEAPPPYEEAVAAARAEQALLAINSHSFSPLNFSNTYLTTHTHTNLSIVANSQNGLPASSPTLLQNNSTNTSPLISSNTRPLSSPAAHSCYQINQIEPAASDLCTGACSTSFASNPNTYEKISTPINRSGLSNSASSITSQQIVPSSNQLLLPNSQNSSVCSHQQYTTLPRLNGAFTISTKLSNSSAGVHRTIPRTPATTSGSLQLRKEYPMHESAVPLFETSLILPKNTTDNGNPSPRSTIPPLVIPSSVPSTSSGDATVQKNIFYDISCPRDSSSISAVTGETAFADNSLCNYKPPLAAANEVNEEGSFDSVTCTCNAQAAAPLHDDTDDYRSECENCKGVTDSKYYLENEDELVTSPHETMTLQRRPEDTTSNVAPHYYRASLTLPTSTRQRTRSSSSRGNWFSSMPESSTESSDGE